MSYISLRAFSQKYNKMRILSEVKSDCLHKMQQIIHSIQAFTVRQAI